MSYNALVGTFPSELGVLEHLEIVHLHSNRIQGNLTIRNYETPNESFDRIFHDKSLNVVEANLTDAFEEAFNIAYDTFIRMSNDDGDGSEVDENELLSLKDAFDKAAFIADCGLPSAFDEPVDCPKCTMCCELISDLVGAQ